MFVTRPYQPWGSNFSPTITLAVGDYEDVAGITLISGKLFDFTDIELADQVAIVDEGFVDAVLTETGQDVVTSTITVGGQLYTIIGVMEGGAGGFGRRSDGSILIPYRSAVGVLTNSTGFSAIALNLVDQSYYEVAASIFLKHLMSLVLLLKIVAIISALRVPKKQLKVRKRRPRCSVYF